MRVVLDTNVLISACLKPAGLEAAMVNMAIGGRLIACITDEVWAEYRDVLFRPKFEGYRGQAELLLQLLKPRALHVTAGARISVASDEDDNRLLECALAAQAEYLITGNLRHFPPHWGPTRVVNARSFADYVVPFL